MFTYVKHIFIIIEAEVISLRNSFAYADKLGGFSDCLIAQLYPFFYSYNILITDIIEGQYRTLLYNRVTLETVPIRASDAVLLSVAARIPIYMESSLMDRQSVRFSGLSHAISMPVNTLSTEMLDKALQKAVDDENYELASHLRDEKKRREKK